MNHEPLTIRVRVSESTGRLLAILIAVLVLAGCTGGRSINYAPVVKQNLNYLEQMSRRMAESAAAEAPRLSTDPTERKAILGAISRGVVREVDGSLGGFYVVEQRQYEGIVEGGSTADGRELDSVEKAQLDVLMQQALQAQRYQENINSFYEREVAQVASPVMVDGKVAAIAWIRYQLPSAIKSITEENKFGYTATSHSAQPSR